VPGRLQNIEERFKVKLKTENLSEKEEEMTQTFLPKYYSDEWVYR
jgi:hypothetical protein